MWCNFTFVGVKLTYFKNDYDDDDKFKKLDPPRAELAGKNCNSGKLHCLPQRHGIGIV